MLSVNLQKDVRHIIIRRRRVVFLSIYSEMYSATGVSGGGIIVRYTGD